MFKKVTVIGMGLIGSSLARAIRKNNLAEKLTAADASKEVCDKVVQLGIADVVTSDIAKSVIGSDLVVLAIPISAIKIVAEQIGPLMMPDAILSDVSSVKGAVIDSVKPYLPESVDLVPAHPIAGTEHSGPEAGLVDLFEDRWCIITPTNETPVRAVERVSALMGRGWRKD